MNDSQPEPQKFKDYYNEELARRLAGQIQQAYPPFAADAFVAEVAARLPPLELKDRVRVFAAALRTHLPPDYPAALAVLATTFGPELPGEVGMFTEGYHLMPVAQFVEEYGLAHVAESLVALNAITRRFSAEFAIRPFLVQHPVQTLAALHEWAHDPNAHVRRLVSEGTRPRLPWAGRLTHLIADPTPALALLEQLKHDPSAYVRKSVANHLNDIAKDHPDLVLATLRRWQAEPSDATTWITRHALRTLVKQGHPDALSLLGVAAPQVTLAELTVAPEALRLGETLTLALTLRSDAPQPQKLVVDYRIHFVKANGQRAPKVFKLRTLTLEPGAVCTLDKAHSFKPVTTRRYYAGLHHLDIQVNGVVLGGADFTLTLA